MAVAKLRGVVEKVERASLVSSRFVVGVRTPYVVPVNIHNAIIPYLPRSTSPSAYIMGDDLVEIWVNAKDELEAYTLVLGCLVTEGYDDAVKEQGDAHQG